MALKVAQGYEYLGGDRWKWWVWIDGDDSELDQVISVEYHLHPTFPQPVREVKDRESKFRLDSAGWGGFLLRAQVRLMDDSVIALSHMLELAYQSVADDAEVLTKAPTRGGEPTQQRSVFLSAGSADSVVATELRTSLIAKGVDVRTGDDIDSGVPWEVEIENAIKNADAVVAIQSDIPSKWMEREVGAATQQGTKVIPVVVGGDSGVPLGHEQAQQIRVGGADTVDAAARSIVEEIET